MVFSFHDHAGVEQCLSSRSFGGRILTHTLMLSSPDPPFCPLTGPALVLSIVLRRPCSATRCIGPIGSTVLVGVTSFPKERVEGTGIRLMVALQRQSDEPAARGASKDAATCVKQINQTNHNLGVGKDISLWKSMAATKRTTDRQTMVVV